MKSEGLNKEGNPIFQGAEQLRSIIKTSIQENLKGIFPKNYQYMSGDYNLIYVIAEGFGNKHDGFYDTAQMVVLTPEGNIQSGKVYQRVESDHSVWEFEKATLREASDLDVVRYAPQLVKNLRDQLEDELTEKEDPKEIERGINFLFNNQDLYMQTLAIAYTALKEMGEEDPGLVHEDTDQPSIEELEKIVQAIKKQHPEYEIVGKSARDGSLDQKKAAIDLFMNKKNLITELKDMALNMRVSLVEQRFTEIVKEIAEKGIFPVSWDDSMKIGWFGSKEISFNGPRPIYSRGVHKKRTWCVSADGLVREFEKKSNGTYEQYSCAEHLLEQAPEILEKIINYTARKFFREIQA